MMTHLDLLLDLLVFAARMAAAWLALWVLFLAVMALRAARDAGRLTKGMPAYRLGMLVLLIGYAVDAAVNIVGATLLFLELPRELTVTARCQRLTKQGGRRGDIARWLCENLLHPIDPKHCT